MSTTDQQMQVAVRVANALYAIIKDFPAGAPSGIVFAAFQEQGCSYAQYMGLVNGLKKAGMLRQTGDLLFAIPEDQWPKSKPST
jgi:hypothetical protein